MFQSAALLISVAALLSWANFKYIKLPSTIGVMLISLLASLAIVIFGEAESGFRGHLTQLVAGIDFHAAIFHGMLPFLLFAGALHVDFKALRQEWLPVTLLALIGTAASVLAVAGGLSLASWLLHLHIPWIGCLLFGALISPTDPVAVLGIMKAAGAPKSLETQIAGESLFNDGVGVVAFVAFVALAAGEPLPSPTGAITLLFHEVGGAIFLGAAVGGVTLYLLKLADNSHVHNHVEILLTLALALGSYALAETLRASAPIAVVVAGLMIGNPGRSFSMSPHTTRRLDEFWELIDEFLNVLLFMLMGLEVLILPLRPASLWAGAAAIIVSLLTRWIIVAAIGVPLRALRMRLSSGWVTLLTWGGLRGGVSLALALALPQADHRDTLLAAAYFVVVFSILAQGLTVGPLVRRFGAQNAIPSAPSFRH